MAPVATAIASYWLGPPECIPEAIAAAAIWMILYFTIKEECKESGGNAGWW
jgi:hypothetical protein